MKYKKLLENLSPLAGDEVSSRRYNLSQMISESYKSLYKCEADTNIRRLAEAHLEDVRKNPTEIERLSRQLCNLNHIIGLVESKKVKDEELLVPEEKYAKVDPPEEDLKESAESARTWSAWQHEYGVAERVRYYSVGQDLTNETVFGTIYAPEGEDVIGYKADIWDNEKSEIIAEPEEDFDTEAQAKDWVEGWFSMNMDESAHCGESKDDLEETATTADEDDDLLEDTELTDEELEELSKHLAEIRKEKKQVNEKVEDRVVQYGIDMIQADGINPSDEADKINKILSDAGYEIVGCMPTDTSWDKEEYGIKESKSYGELNLSEFSKKSNNKAFVKTFKKLGSKLQEGTALTRQESIALYKAANSAMTHLSVELEHNPEFLGTFNESVSLLSTDVNKILNSLKEGKAPSKATMKSLAKFSNVLLNESSTVTIKDSDKEVKYEDIGGGFGKNGEILTLAEIKEYWNDNRESDEVLNKYDSFEEWFKDTKENYLKDYDEDIKEAEDEDLPPIEDDDEVIVSDEEVEEPEEGEVTEEDEFDQEYADARIELHNELAEEHADDDNPEIQEKIAQDAEEVANLPGVTEEQAAELLGEEVPETEEESTDDESEEEEDIDEMNPAVVGALAGAASSITKRVKDVNFTGPSFNASFNEGSDEEVTPDELEELKKHLTEMRSSKKIKESKARRLKRRG